MVLRQELHRTSDYGAVVVGRLEQEPARGPQHGSGCGRKRHSSSRPDPDDEAVHRAAVALQAGCAHLSSRVEAIRHDTIMSPPFRSSADGTVSNTGRQSSWTAKT